MTLAETHQMLVLIAGWYGTRRVPADEPTVAAWHAVLGNHDVSLVSLVVRKWGAEKATPPTPSDIVSAVRHAAVRRAQTRALPSAGCPSCGGTGWQWRSQRNTVSRCDRGCLPPIIDRTYRPQSMSASERDHGRAGLRRVTDALASARRGRD